MSEIEVPIEQVQEDMHHKAMHSTDKMFSIAALMSAGLAVFAAIAALLAGHHSNEAMIEQIKASDNWSYYQAKGIKSAVLETQKNILDSMGKAHSEKIDEKLNEYKKDQEEIFITAKEKEEKTEYHLSVHNTLAKAVTLFQVAIAIAAIAVLARKRFFLFISGSFGILGLYFFIAGLIL